ncbi:probable beta-1,3-galactosyltransferase 12 isoform X2 [Diospyros lotus]|uniref:probable beta-1,3-galactosyltransferase 12 isoform X2 n=1 Tax=Diospyros lotus TaxID=55363 RepID=UPI0022550D43|nr:probable beta-1,3-galactosyltransferase 12 isoform X2 [Diospyros lotus]
MQRPHSLSADNYSKSLKTKKPLSQPPQPRSSLPIIVFSVFCLLFGLAGTIFSLSVTLRPKPVPVFRCGRTEDTFRGFYSLPIARRLGGDTGAAVDRPKFLGFVGIQTGFASADRRAALRSTWFASDPDGLLRLEQATGLAFRFVIGRSKDAKRMAELEKEIQQYKDFMLIDVEEEYLKLPYKTLAFFKAAFDLFEADYYVKADDDIYLRPDRLATLLAKERSHSRTYIGCMKKGPVITDPKMKCLRMFNNEDVTIGSWMLAMNVHHEDNRAICDPRCTLTSIAVWDIPKCSGLCNPAIRMKELHNMTMCSKTPTLPPDDR